MKFGVTLLLTAAKLMFVDTALIVGDVLKRQKINKKQTLINAFTIKIITTVNTRC